MNNLLDPPIEVVDAVQLDQVAAAQLAELLHEIWPQDASSLPHRAEQLCRQWCDYAGSAAQRPRYFCVRQANQLLATALAAPRTIGTTRGHLTVLALARVCVTPQARGRGLGQAVVQAAFELVDCGAYPFALYQTSYEVQPFYERLGACVVANHIINSADPCGKKCPFWEKVVMRYPDHAGWPEGTIDLWGTGY